MEEKQDANIEIPMDVFESTQELVIIIPLGWVRRESISIFLERTTLSISWNREMPKVKESLQTIQQECFWWYFEKKIDLPTNVYFDKIQTELTKENILIVTVPKIIIPEKVKLEVRHL